MDFNCSNMNQTMYGIPATLMEGDYVEEMKLAVEVALKAGEKMIPHLEQKGTLSGIATESTLGVTLVTKTNETDFATQIDLENEVMIMKAIKDAYPDHFVIGEEETGTNKVKNLTDAKTWIIDPIDGTTNFASGSPLTCVSIGFCYKGEPVMGVVFSPKTCELYLAMNGMGAYRNGERIFSTPSNNNNNSADPTPEPTITLSNAVVCFEFGYARSPESVTNMTDAVKRILLHGCRTTRSYGCGVLDLCYVASGRIDVVYTGIVEEGWKPWDYCAGMVVVEEAGGIIRSLKGDGEFHEDGTLVKGSRFDIYSASMVCGVNPKVVEECRKVVLNIM